MEIKIQLPQADSVSTYQQLKAYLKQLELAVHHAQKSIESAEQMGVELSEDTYVAFDHPILESSVKSDGNKEADKTLSNFFDNYYEELQYIELKINLA